MKHLTLAILIVFFLVLPIHGSAASGDQFTGIFGFVLYQTKLKEIQNRLGYIDIVEKGEATEYTASLCYVLPGQNLTITFLSGFFSHGEIVDGLIVREGQDTAKTCRVLHSKFIPTSDLGSLKIGMTVVEYETLMQSGQKLSGPPKAEYHFVNKKPKTEGELEQERKYSLDPLPYRNVLTQVIGTFTKQRLIEFRIFTGLI